MITAVQRAPAESKWWAWKTLMAGWKGGMNIEEKKMRANQMGLEKKGNTFNHSLSSNKLAFPTLIHRRHTAQLHWSHCSHHPLSCLLERASWCSLMTKMLPDGWAVIFSCADNQLLSDLLLRWGLLLSFLDPKTYLYHTLFMTYCMSMKIVWKPFLHFLQISNKNLFPVWTHWGQCHYPRLQVHVWSVEVQRPQQVVKKTAESSRVGERGRRQPGGQTDENVWAANSQLTHVGLHGSRGWARHLWSLLLLRLFK